MKRLFIVLMICAIFAGIATANLGERRRYPHRQPFYEFFQSRDPNNWWDDVNDVYTIVGELICTDANFLGTLNIKDANVTGNFKFNGLTADRLMYTNAGKQVKSVTDLTSWIAGTTNQVTVTDDGDGTVTLSAPQDLHTGASPTFVKTTLTGDEINIATSQTPATASAAGTTGDIAWDSDYLYVAVSTNTWKRAAISTWVTASENVIYAAENVVFAAEQVVYP